MKIHPFKIAAALGLILASAVAISANVSSARREESIARGRYLVERVGLCADCHTPRNEKGEFLHERWLAGSPLAFSPTVPMPWSPAAPMIAGLPTMNEAEAVIFLQTGKRPNGTNPLPPMPAFRFNEADATAITAYLKSLAP